LEKTLSFFFASLIRDVVFKRSVTILEKPASKDLSSQAGETIQQKGMDA